VPGAGPVTAHVTDLLAGASHGEGEHKAPRSTQETRVR